MVLLSRKSFIALEVESTEGTVVALTGADATFRSFDPAYSYDPEIHNRDANRKYRGQSKGVLGKKPATISWRTEVKGSGTAATKPAWNDSLLACGFTAKAVSSMTITITTAGTFNPMEEIIGATSGATGRVVGEVPQAAGTKLLYFVPVSATPMSSADVITGQVSATTAAVDNAPNASKGWEYTPDTDNHPSTTVAKYMDGKYRRARGARGTATVEGVAGAPLMYNFSYSGIHNDEADAALLSPTYESTNVPVLESSSMAFFGITECVDAFTLDLGNDVVERPCATAAAGVKSYRITDWAPQITIDPEDVLVATASFTAQMSSRAEGRFYAQVGSVGGQRVSIAAPKMSYAGVQEGDRNGILTALLTFDLLVTSTTTGDDELQIAVV